MSPYSLAWDLDGRFCSQCESFKAWDEFSPRAAGKNGRNSVCRVCVASQRQQWRNANRELVNAQGRERDQRSRRHIRRRYGLSGAEYDALVEAQAGRCAICEQVPKRLVVDHCHAGGQVRELLCDRCNIALSAVETSGLLDRLLAYRDRHVSPS